MKVRIALSAGLALSLFASHATAQESVRARFAGIMDSVFGAGAWRITGGYRTPEREDQLRAQGAMTVRPGGLSRHSLGSPEAPGAYDLVVDGMSPYEAAERLRRAGAPFARYQPKGTHGSQGPHLHLEPYSYDLRATGPAWPSLIQASYSPPRASYTSPRRERPLWDTGGLMVVEEGFRRAPREAQPEPAIEAAPATLVARPADEVLEALRDRARNDDAQAQLELGRAFAEGKKAPKNVGAALAWMELVADNPRASPEMQAEARAMLSRLTRRRDADREAEVQVFAAQQARGGRGVVVVPATGR